VFSWLLEFTYPKYKAFGRRLYQVKGLIFYRFRNKEKWMMVRKICLVMPYTLVGIGGLEATYNIVKEVCKRNLPGDIVELGVARGGCAAMMASVMFDQSCSENPVRKLWLFDSFEGLPGPTEKDFNAELGVGTGEHLRPLSQGSCLGTLDEVRHLMLNKNNFPENQIVFVKGWFEDTIPDVGKTIAEIAVLRIDADWYESTKRCLEGLYDRVVEQGFVIIDDYQSCYGCRRAVDEFFQQKRFSPDMKYDGRGGCYFSKMG
jgi:hypothetical protein